MKNDNLTKKTTAYTGIAWQTTHGLFCPQHGVLGAPLLALGLLPAPILNKIDQAKHGLEHIIEKGLDKGMEVQTKAYLDNSEILPNAHQIAETSVELGTNAWFIAGASYVLRNQLKETQQYFQDKLSEYQNSPYLKKIILEKY